MTGTAIKTNGEGSVTFAHLNLTRTMADVWRVDLLAAARAEKNRELHRAKRESHSAKAHYAGAPL